jgi:D-alanyl-D-alanine carboxypeptidase
MRLAIGACIVVIMVAITVIALKLGSRHEEAGSGASTGATPAASQAARATASAGTAGPATATATGQPRQGSIAAPSTTPAPKHRTAPTDPADVGVLVNKQHPLKPSTYVPQGLASVDGQKLRKDAATSLRRLTKAAKNDGHDLTLLSGYRSADRQEELHQAYIQRNGRKEAERLSARAGESEHQTGLAADVGNGTCDLEECFGSTAAGRWVAKHAHEYGFVVRYPKGQEKVTGYTFEPWHLRYLGPELTEDFRASDAATLEAYYGLG